MSDYRAILDEHVGLRAMARELREQACGKAPMDAKHLLKALEQLSDKLKRHFAVEEEGGFFIDIAAQRPSLDRRVAKLLKEHGTLLERIDSLVSMVQAGQPIPAVCAQLVDTLDVLNAHEQAEVDLIQDSSLIDIGPGD